MTRIFAIIALATFCSVAAARAQTSERQPARDPAADRDRAGPSSPADVPNWMAHAVGDILDRTSKTVDDATHDHR